MPRFDQTACFRDVVDDQCGLRVAVVHGCERSEALLARGIPDLEFDGAVGEVTFLSEKCGADGGFLVGLESVGDEAEDEGGLG
jgi:hypothetical protein